MWHGEIERRARITAIQDHTGLHDVPPTDRSVALTEDWLERNRDEKRIVAKILTLEPGEYRMIDISMPDVLERQRSE